MKLLNGLISLAAVYAQLDEQTNLLQTKTSQNLQQRSSEAEDCYSSGGCHTTSTTTPAFGAQRVGPPVKRPPTRPTRKPTTTAAPTEPPTRPTRKPTTTAAPTEPPTRPTRKPTTTAAPTEPPTTTKKSTTTEKPTTTTTTNEDVKVDGDGDLDGYCGPEATVFDDVSCDGHHMPVNNLGGMGPYAGKRDSKYYNKPWIVYEGVTSVDGRQVNLKVSDATATSDDAADGEYTKAHQTHRTFKGNTGKEFIDSYNGNYRAGVVTVGALFEGKYKIKFSFFYDDNNEPATLKFLPLTFYDLDGEGTKDGRSYEIASTQDAEGVASYKKPAVPGLKHSFNRRTGVARVEGVQKEIDIPMNFKKLDSTTKSAAATFLFYEKDSVVLEYELNYGHRVFLMKGSKSLACEDAEEEKPARKPAHKPAHKSATQRQDRFRNFR